MRESDLYVYIDEAGDEGFSDASTRWFIVSAIAIDRPHFHLASQIISEFLYRCQFTHDTMSFKKLKHEKRKEICALLGRIDYLTIHAAFDKFHLPSEQKYLQQYPSMYYAGVRLVVERATFLAKQLNRQKVHVQVATRNTLKMKDLEEYVLHISRASGENHAFFERIGKFEGGNITDKGIIMADIIASSMFQCVEPHKIAGIGDEVFFNMCIKKKLFSSTHPDFTGVSGNGLICISNRSRQEESGTLTEGGVSDS